MAARSSNRHAVLLVGLLLCTISIQGCTLPHDDRDFDLTETLISIEFGLRGSLKWTRTDPTDLSLECVTVVPSLSPASM